MLLILYFQICGKNLDCMEVGDEDSIDKALMGNLIYDVHDEEFGCAHMD